MLSLLSPSILTVLLLGATTATLTPTAAISAAKTPAKKVCPVKETGTIATSDKEDFSSLEAGNQALDTHLATIKKTLAGIATYEVTSSRYSLHFEQRTRIDRTVEQTWPVRLSARLSFKSGNAARKAYAALHKTGVDGDLSVSRVQPKRCK